MNNKNTYSLLLDIEEILVKIRENVEADIVHGSNECNLLHQIREEIVSIDELNTNKNIPF